MSDLLPPPAGHGAAVAADRYLAWGVPGRDEPPPTDCAKRPLVELPVGYAVVEVTHAGIAVGGAPVVPLDKGRVLGADTLAIAPLVEALRSMRSHTDAAIAVGCPPAPAVTGATALLLAADRRIPADTITRVFASAGEAGWSEIDVLVDGAPQPPPAGGRLGADEYLVLVSREEVRYGAETAELTRMDRDVTAVNTVSIAVRDWVASPSASGWGVLVTDGASIDLGGLLAYSSSLRREGVSCLSLGRLPEDEPPPAAATFPAADDGPRLAIGETLTVMPYGLPAASPEASGPRTLADGVTCAPLVPPGPAAGEVAAPVAPDRAENGLIVIPGAGEDGKDLLVAPMATPR